MAIRETIIFGVDPGSNTTGFGVIKLTGNQVGYIDAGTIVTPPKAALSEKLLVIYNGLLEQMHKYNPACVCVEEAFYAKNVHTTLILGHARGVVLLAAAQIKAQISEYSPREVKKALVGNGNAEKEQVAYMVQVLLKPPVKNLAIDATDALAVALCGMYQIQLPAVLRSK